MATTPHRRSLLAKAKPQRRRKGAPGDEEALEAVDSFADDDGYDELEFDEDQDDEELDDEELDEDDEVVESGRDAAPPRTTVLRTARMAESDAFSDMLDVVEQGESGAGFERTAADDIYSMDDPVSEEIRVDPTFRKLHFTTPEESEERTERMRHPAIDAVPNRPDTGNRPRPQAESTNVDRDRDPAATVLGAAQVAGALDPRLVEPQASQQRPRTPDAVDGARERAPVARASERAPAAPPPSPGPTLPRDPRPPAAEPAPTNQSELGAYGLLAVLGSGGVLALGVAALMLLVGIGFVAWSLASGTDQELATIPDPVTLPAPAVPTEEPTPAAGAEEPVEPPVADEPVAEVPTTGPAAPRPRRPKAPEPVPETAPAPAPEPEVLPPPPAPEPEPEPGPTEEDDKKGPRKKKKK